MKDDGLRELFGVPPAEFVKARDAQAKELRAAGREAEAKQVAALRRPTAAVWAVNQLARRAPGEVEALLEASDRVRKAQMRGAAGDELRAAMSEQRAALAKLERAAEQILRGSGMQPSPAATRAVQTTLQAAATGPREVREKLRKGMLEEALEASGFEALLGATPPPARRRQPTSAPTPAVTSTPTAASRRAAQAEEREARRRAQQQAREERRRAQEVRRLEARLRKLEAASAAAGRAAEAARKAVETARAELQRLRA